MYVCVDSVWAHICIESMYATSCFQFDIHFPKIASHPTGVFNTMPWNFRYWPSTWPVVHASLEIFLLELDRWVVWQGRRHSKGKPHEVQRDLWIKLVFSGICFYLLVYELFFEHGHYGDLGRQDSNDTCKLSTRRVMSGALRLFRSNLAGRQFHVQSISTVSIGFANPANSVLTLHVDIYPPGN